MRKLIGILIFLLTGLFSCNNQKPESLSNEIPFLDSLVSDTIKYAKGFNISRNKNGTLICLTSIQSKTDTTAKYFITSDTTIHNKQNITVIHSCDRIISLGSVYSNMLFELGALNKIVAIECSDYYNNKAIIDKFKSNEITEVNCGPLPDIEKMLKLDPDIIFAFGTGNSFNQQFNKLIKASIPVIISGDHLENDPLARAEWIKFFAAFTNCDQKAKEIFTDEERKYNEIKRNIQLSDNKPKIFSEIMFGELWYVPGGKSFMSLLINDAGGSYVWNDDVHTGSIALDFEKVYTKAKKADVWINLSMINSKKELASHDKRYSEFDAFKKNKVFNNNKNTNTKGYSDYWETGLIHPHRILFDLSRIFYYNYDSIQNDLYYYKKIN